MTPKRLCSLYDGLSVIQSGIITAIITLITFQFLFNRDNQFWIFVTGILLLSSIFLVFVSLYIGEKTELMRQWKDLINEDLDTFPRTEIERTQLQKKWVSEYLRCYAISVNAHFQGRDSHLEVLNYQLSAGTTLSNLVSYRQTLQAVQEEQTQLEHLADKFHTKYLVIWDLFRALQMLPDGADNPNVFRLEVLNSQDSVQDSVSA